MSFDPAHSNLARDGVDHGKVGGDLRKREFQPRLPHGDLRQDHALQSHGDVADLNRQIRLSRQNPSNSPRLHARVERQRDQRHQQHQHRERAEQKDALEFHELRKGQVEPARVAANRRVGGSKRFEAALAARAQEPGTNWSA